MKVFDYNFSSTTDSIDVNTTDLESIFNVNKDKNGNYVYNLNSTVFFQFNQDDMNTFTCQGDMYWPLISYKIYGTTRLSWLLMKLNNITPEQCMEIIKSGSKVRYLEKQTIQQLINELIS